jgi:uncharacterized protein (UPF0335 family)
MRTMIIIKIITNVLTPINTEQKTHFITYFQKMLQNMLTNLFSAEKELKTIEYQVKHIWMAYLNVVKQNYADITGVFRKVVKNTKQKLEEKHEGEATLEEDSPEKIEY